MHRDALHGTCTHTRRRMNPQVHEPSGANSEHTDTESSRALTFCHLLRSHERCVARGAGVSEVGSQGEERRQGRERARGMVVCTIRASVCQAQGGRVTGVHARSSIGRGAIWRLQAHTSITVRASSINSQPAAMCKRESGWAARAKTAGAAECGSIEECRAPPAFFRTSLASSYIRQGV